MISIIKYFIVKAQLANHPTALWTVVYAGNGKFGIQGSNGKYLARCNGCIPNVADEDMVFVHSIDPKI